MHKFQGLLGVLLVMLLLIVPPNIASALQLNINNFDLKDRMQFPFISQHEVVKAVPIYRVMRTGEWYNAGGTHVYTMNKDEFDSWLGTGKAVDDGIAGYISPVALPYTAPLYNMVKNSTEQYFAPSDEIRDEVIIKYNYENYGTWGYIVPIGDSGHGTAEMHSWYKGSWDKVADLGVGANVNWNADHYYNAAVIYVDTDKYKYNGTPFRCWSAAAVLQEIDVLAPNGGETLTGGSKTDIRWDTLQSGGNVSLYYTLNPEEGWSVIAENVANTGSYSWTVPNSATSNAIVEARWTYEGNDVNCYDQSDKFFTITKTTSTLPIQIKPQFDLSRLYKPATPSGLTTSSGIWQKQPSLTWHDNANNETSYVVERKEGGGTFSKLTETAANTEKYLDKTAKAGVKYVYRVKAVNGAAASSYSNEAAGAVFTLPEISPPKLPESETGVSMLFTLNQNTYVVNGQTQTMDVSPASIEGRTMLPIRFAADPLGADTNWDSNERKVSVTLGETQLELWIGSSTAKLNGSPIQIDPQNPGVKPLIVNGRTMLPMRFVAEKLGCGVEWLPDTKQIKVDYANTWLDPQPEPPM